jgi:hypothetical protein
VTCSMRAHARRPGSGLGTADPALPSGCQWVRWRRRRVVCRGAGCRRGLT